jgi:hypothetical protein
LAVEGWLWWKGDIGIGSLAKVPVRCVLVVLAAQLCKSRQWGKHKGEGKRERQCGIGMGSLAKASVRCVSVVLVVWLYESRWWGKHESKGKRERQYGMQVRDCDARRMVAAAVVVE